ncbi:MAG: YhbY family RNA-binding protein [Burkholderiales bacterium]
MTELNSATRKRLKTRAHALHPILQLGEKGLSDALVAEIDRALSHHELIKVRAAPLNRDERDVALASICERTGAAAVQHIGKIFVLYREKPPQEAPAEAKPRLQRRPGTGRPDAAQDRKPPRRRRPAGTKRPQRRRPRE